MDMPDKYTQIDQRSRHDMDHANNRTHDNVKTCIFISYASEDREFANRLSSDLQTRGYTCWLDQWQVDVGECVLSKMDQGLRQSRYFVFILSKNSVKSSWVDVEWKTAYWQEIEAQSTIVLPVLKSNCDVPTFLRSRKYADFRESYQSGLAELCAALEKHDLDHALHKRKVWYWDDKPDALASFVKRHKDIFDIKCFNDVVEFLDSIRHIKPTSPEFPDVALVDLYALRSSTSIDKGEIEEACKKMELLLQLERNLKDYVDDAWESSGVEVVRWVRESYSFEELPISLYTQRGLVLLEDDLIMELEMFGTSWLLKNQFSPETERIMLNRQMQYGINAAIPGSKNLLLIDDNANFCKEFKARHASSYYIMSVRDQSQVLPTIIKMKQEGRGLMNP